MTREHVVEARRVSKKFCRSLRRSLYYGIRDIASECTGRERFRDLRPGEFWALRDVGLTLERGEAVGLVGENGAGKTTLLRLLSGLIKPDGGEIRIAGSVAPLIALEAAFNPLLSGWENAHVNLAILGVEARDMTRKVQEVVEFSELSDSIEAPVRTYSSGMAARLGFACAVGASPDILLIDEVLAVGDVRFRNKCYRRLAELRENGTALILVSHSATSILSVCEKAVWLSHGRVAGTGPSAEVVTAYERSLVGETASMVDEEFRAAEKGSGESTGVDIVSVAFLGPDGTVSRRLTTGEPARLALRCKVRRATEDVSVAAIIRELTGEIDPVLYLNSALEGKAFSLSEGSHFLEVIFPFVGLRPGSYVLKLSVVQGQHYTLDTATDLRFSVEAGVAVTSQSRFFQPHEWVSRPGDPA